MEGSRGARNGGPAYEDGGPRDARDRQEERAVREPGPIARGRRRHYPATFTAIIRPDDHASLTVASPDRASRSATRASTLSPCPSGQFAWGSRSSMK